MSTRPDLDGPENGSAATTRNRIRYLRLRSRLTQRELGKLIDLDHTTVSHHENGSRGLTGDQITRYAAVFKCETYELFQEPAAESAYVEEPTT